MQYLQEFKQQTAGRPYAKYYNLGCYEIWMWNLAFLFQRRFSGRDHIRASETPGGKAVTCLHVGPHSDVAPSYRALVEWVKDKGYEGAGLAYEVYLEQTLKSTPARKVTNANIRDDKDV